MVKNKMCDFRKMYEVCGYSSLVRYLFAQKGRDSILFRVRPSTCDSPSGLIILRWIFRLKHSVLARGPSSLHSYVTRGKRM